MSALSTAALFLLVLIVLILVHELGHFIVAKWTKMRVDEFGIGFPPKLLGWRKGETLYTLNALPLGGFVSIYGEDPTKISADSPDQSRAFGSRPKWAQILVLLAGVTMNVLLAFILLVVINLVGAPTMVTEFEATPAASLQVGAVLPNSPAAVLPLGATITAVGNVTGQLETLTPSTVSDFIAASYPEAVDISYTVSSEEEVKTVTLTPEVGLSEATPDRAVVGVSLALVENIKLPFLSAVNSAAIETVTLLKAITVGVYDLITGLFTNSADLSQVTGPIGIANYVGEAAAVGMTSLLFFVAIISLNLAVINLLPIPALDGGRLVFVLIEIVTRRPLDHKWSMRVNLVGFLLLMMLMLAVTIGDISRLW